MKRHTSVLLAIGIVLALCLLALGSCGMSSAIGTQTHEGEQDHVHGQWEDEMPPLSAVALGEGQKLRVVASTSIVADVVQNVGGERIELTVLIPPGTDPHTFEPTPRDAAAVADAHVVFINGAGLEVFLDRLLESAGGSVPVVPVSAGLNLLHAGDHEEGGEQEADHEHGDYDPHVWLDPENVALWTQNIERALQALDPAGAGLYEANASTYRGELEALDAWILEQVRQIPEQDRLLVTDHRVLTYFAQRYGFEQVGAVLPGYSTMSAPSAQELAALQEDLAAYGVRAIFVSQTVRSSLVEQVVADAGVQLVYLYTGSLSEAGGPADSYLELMRYNVSAIVQALR